LKAAAKQPVVCYVTDRKSSDVPDTEAGAISKTLENIRRTLEAGADWVQIREKDLPAQELLGLARQAVEVAAETGASTGNLGQIIINDRLDVALAAGAYGVHLGRESLAARDLVRWCRAGNAPAEFAIGVSCHSLQEAREAESAKADYIFFGPIFETPSKEKFGAPQGIERLTELCRALKAKVIAIGGVNEENAASCIRAGADGIAAIRLFQDSHQAGEVRKLVASIHALGTEKI
jgi:thiamine-phosphate pyrophosphorylase